MVGGATKVVGGATTKGGSTTVALTVAPLFNSAIQQSLDKVVPPDTCMVCGADKDKFIWYKYNRKKSLKLPRIFHKESNKVAMKKWVSGVS